MERAIQAERLTLISGLALIFVASLGLLLFPFPLPLLTVFPAFLLDNVGLMPAAIFIPALLFFAWNPGLFRGSNRIPIRTYILFMSVSVSDVLWFIKGWNYGLQYQGKTYTCIICALNAAWIGLLTALFLRYRKSSTFPSNLLVHVLLFGWLGLFAFPYLGELP